MKLPPFTNSCFYHMVDCDTTCNWWMRFLCALRCIFIRDYKSLVTVDDDQLIEADIDRQDAAEAKFKAKAKELGIHDLDKWKSPASDTDPIITDDEDD